MLGLMQDRPLLISQMIDFAAAYYPDVEIVTRTVEGPIASIRSERPDELSYSGSAASLQDVWVALRANMRAVLESVTLADVAKGELPAEVRRLTAEPDVWEPH